MLSDEEKREMLEDAMNQRRREDFNFTRSISRQNISFDNYLAFLNNVQRLFSPFTISKDKTITRINKL